MPFDDELDARERQADHERRAPICPACGVTALPALGPPAIDPDFVCENPDCPSYGDVIT